MLDCERTEIWPVYAISLFVHNNNKQMFYWVVTLWLGLYNIYVDYPFTFSYVVKEALFLFHSDKEIEA